MRDRNFYPREIEYGSGLWVYTAGGFTGVRQVFFYIPTLFLSFSSLLESPPPPSPSPPSASAWGPTPCARNLNPLVIKSGLYATAGLPRAFTYEKVKCIQVEVPIYRAVSADQV